MERKGVWTCIFLILAIALAVYIVSRPSKENYDYTPSTKVDDEVVLIPPHVDDDESHDGIEIIHNDEA